MIITLSEAKGLNNYRSHHRWDPAGSKFNSCIIWLYCIIILYF